MVSIVLAFWKVIFINVLKEIDQFIEYWRLKFEETDRFRTFLYFRRGSGFSIKTASIIGLLFGGFHLSLVRSSNKHQK